MPKTVIFNLRIPPNIDRAIRIMADANDRSVHAQIINMLKSQVPADLLDHATVDIAKIQAAAE